ncbi:LuxR C-terminal-related transcriptional regulator [Marmoricola sp. RAF53]|uniref:LuxR C-terminal-related transcriptional regulator n=1 Tax=Marmoricola sp. RAF53 TaxID=3233059 RepID=UPI003F992114
MDTPFFRSKFTAPGTPHHVVARERLLDLLDDLSAYPVTAVVAPAGAGKTALAADWVRRRDRVAWLSLDESDRDPVQFWAALVVALDRLAPGIGERAGVLPDGVDDLEPSLRVLADDLAVLDAEEAVLVLDDVHRVEGEPATEATLRSFVEHKPDWLHLLLLSRRRPPLPVERLRATGTLADVGFDVLRFTTDEGVALLAGLCPGVAADELGPVALRADGWAAALQLAALAIRAHGHEHALVDDYVWHEVLRAERPDLIDLLLAVSVVDRVNYGLAETLTGRADAGDLLEEAESRGLFVTRLDTSGWFEVHGLVRDLLTAESRRRSAQDLRTLHARAARWFESVGDGATALEHWLDAEDPERALLLLADLAAPLAHAGRGALVTRVLDRLPAEVAHTDPAAQVRVAWCRLHVDRTGFVEALPAVDEAAADQATRERLAVLRAAARFADGDWAGAARAARETVAGAGIRPGLDPVAGHAWSLVAHGLALTECWDDDGPEVLEARLGAAADPDRRTAFEGPRAIGLALAGQPLDALRAAAGVRRVARAAGMQTLRTELSLADALVAVEIGDREQARAELDGLVARTAYPMTFAGFVARIQLTELAVGDGLLDEAAVALRAAETICREELGLREFGAAGAASLLARTGTSLALAQEDLTAATRWAQRVQDPFWGPVEAARVHLAGGDRPAAAAALEPAVPRCPRHRVVADLVAARVLPASERERAVKAVTAAVETAAEHGMLQTVAWWGAGLVETIELAAWRVPDGWMQRLRRVLVPGLDEGAEDGAVEHLTSREREVLRLLPTRLTHREIATELFVSQNTLKFHLRLIYRKLGVNSRADAVERARRLGLLRR